MKRTLVLLALLAPALAVHAADTALQAVPKTPVVYADNLTRSQLPVMFDTDRGAFALYEALQQSAETFIQVNGCKPVNGTFETYVDQDGIGDLTLTTPGSSLKLEVVKTEEDRFRGARFHTFTKTGLLSGLELNEIDGSYVFNAFNTIMTGSTDVTAQRDLFTSTVIKDFYRETITFNEESRDATLDWGLQVIHKLGFPVAKYWQRSYSWHDDGVEGKVKFVKDRIAGGSNCRIVVRSHGLGNSEIFSQKGIFKILPL